MYSSPFLIINPDSGSFSRRRITRVVDSLKSSGLFPIIHPVRNPVEALPPSEHLTPTAETVSEISSRREWCRTTDLYRVKVALYR